MFPVLPISPYDQITLQVNRPTRLACHTKIIETLLPKTPLMIIESIRIYHLEIFGIPIKIIPET